MERANAERRKLDDSESPGRQSLLEPRRRRTAGGKDDHDRLRLEARQREPQHRRRRLVEPLDVVDREHEPLCGCQRRSQAAQGVEKRERNDALIRRSTIGLREGERGFERPPLGARKVSQDPVDDTPDEIGHADEREVSLGLRGPGREHQ